MDGQIKKANIFYSPYTVEKPEHFRQLNSIYNVGYSLKKHEYYQKSSRFANS